MDHLSKLPDELLLYLAEYFLYDDLTALALTSRKLNRGVHGRLQHHKLLKRQYTIICDRSWRASNLRLGWFDILARLLKQSFPAEYVSTVRLTNCPWYWRELSTFLLEEDADSENESANGFVKKPWQNEDMTMVIRAALSSPWIYRDGSHPCGPRSAAINMSEFVREVKEGDMDNILAILLPLLPDLERFELAPGRDGVMDEDQPSSHCIAQSRSSQ